MANGKTTTAVTTAPQGGAVQPENFVTYRNRITSAVLKRIGELGDKGITVPAGFNANNQIYLAFLTLSQMETRDRKPLLSAVSPQSVANALLEMCLKGLSLEKKQCAFIQYGDQVRLQEEYHGRVALAKRYGAGDPQAQVIYEGDEFEYEINPKTGKISVTKHIQKLANIDKAKIVGAWALVPYAEHPDWDPKVDVMTIGEIRQSWTQGATKGESPAHRNFTGEMCKKTVISRAVKLFISTSSDNGDYDPIGSDNEVENQEAVVVDPTANATEVDITGLPAAPSETAVKEGVLTESDDMPDFGAQAAPTAEPEKITVESPRPASVPAGAAEFEPDSDFFKA